MANEIKKADAANAAVVNKVDYRNKMINLYNSTEYQELSAYYAKKSAFSVLGIARQDYAQFPITGALMARPTAAR